MLSQMRRQRRKTLSDTMVEALLRRPGFHPDPELPKHGIRVRQPGVGAYYIVTRDPARKQRWIKIGSTAEMKITEAREQARTVIKRIEAGLDAVEAPPVKPDSVADVIETFLKRHVEKKQLRTGGEVRRVLHTYILPRWANRPFAALKRSDIAKLLDDIEDKRGPWIADAVLAQLRSVASWFASRNDDYQLPFVRGMRRVVKHERKRSRILNDAELRAVWQAAEAAGVFGGLVRMLLLTAQRRDKVCGMKHSDISPDGVWTIRTEPGEKGNAGALTLPPLALATIKAMPRFLSNDHVFAGAGSRSRANFSKDKVKLDVASGVTGWTLHDLRRTAKTLMSRAGVRPDIGERVLGHSLKGVEGVYDQHTYDSEKADALLRLATLIERIVNRPKGRNILRDARLGGL